MSEEPQPYVRWRPRMVRESVLEDLRSVLEEQGWWTPAENTAPYGFMHGSPLVLTEAWPEEAEYQGEKIAKNTLAVDQGVPGEPYNLGMGGGPMGREYMFTYAFYAVNDATASALFQDLSDRYFGRRTKPGVSPGDPPKRYYRVVPLFDYTKEPAALVVDMDIESFRFNRSVDQIAPGFDLYFAELVVTDYIDDEPEPGEGEGEGE